MEKIECEQLAQVRDGLVKPGLFMTIEADFYESDFDEKHTGEFRDENYCWLGFSEIYEDNSHYHNCSRLGVATEGLPTFPMDFCVDIEITWVHMEESRRQSNNEASLI
jgi:hypothetical protein